jgi:protein-tyrosine phosphatase
MSRSKKHGHNKGAHVYHFDRSDEGGYHNPNQAPMVSSFPGGTQIGGGPKASAGGQYTPVQTGQYGSGTPHTPYVKCAHDGSELVYMQRETGIGLSGAARMDMDTAGMDVVVDCSGMATAFIQPALSKIPPGFEALQQYAGVPVVLSVDWPDRRIPLLQPGFWRKLWELLTPGWQVAFCCVGGHGRTGTALACMLVADGWTAQQAIDHVRLWHCAKAVETRGQEAYVLRVQQALWGEDAACRWVKEDSSAWVVEGLVEDVVDTVAVVGG